MKYKYALKLHAGDEVRHKKTGEVYMVLSSIKIDQDIDLSSGKSLKEIYLYCVDKDNAPRTMVHKEIE